MAARINTWWVSTAQESASVARQSRVAADLALRKTQSAV
jgi:hypothetical protein